MSGPKTLNIRIHDAKLNSIISQQAEIRTLAHFVDCFAIHDPEHHFNFVGSGLLDKLRSELSECLRSVVIPKETELSYGQSAAFGTAIQNKLSAIARLKTRLVDFKAQCECAQEDYIHSVAALDELQGCKKEQCEKLLKLMESIEAYLHKQDAQTAPQDVQTVLGKLKAIPTEVALPDFCLDLYKLKPHWLDKLRCFYQEQETTVFDLHANYCSDLNMNAIKKSGLKKHPSQERQQLLGEIQEILEKLPDSDAKQKVISDLEFYENSPDYCSETTHKHLKNKLLGIMSSTTRRYELLVIQHKLCGLPPSGARSGLLKLVQTEIDNDLITESTFEKLHQAWEALEADTHKQQLDIFAKEQESRYIKDKVIKALEELNYTVVPDAKGLQDSQSSLVFKVPNQENYICVEYLKGKFLYNFLVPEKVAELSKEDLRRKVAEMGGACQGFLQAMKNLQDYGLSFDYSHKEAGENSVISIPEKLRKSKDLESMHHEEHRQHATAQKRMSNDQ